MCGVVQVAHDRRGARHLAGHHVVVAAVPQRDRIGVLGVQRRQLGDGLGHGAAEVVLGVPRPRAHLGEEPLDLVVGRQHLAVEVARVPVEEHPAEVEDDGV